MKRILCLFLAYLMVFQTFNKLTIVAFYQMNKQVIAEVFCVNKDRPELNCDGKCFLAQKLQAEDAKKEKQDPYYLTAGFEILFDIQAFDLDLRPGEVNASHSTVPYLVKPYTASLSRVFHPPIGC